MGAETRCGVCAWPGSIQSTKYAQMPQPRVDFGDGTRTGKPVEDHIGRERKERDKGKEKRERSITEDRISTNMAFVSSREMLG